MLFVVVLLCFAFAGVVTSGLVHTPRAWHVAMGFTALCAGLLAFWTGQLLQRTARYLSADVSAPLAFGVAAFPFAALLLRLWVRRRNTPRHIPSPDDDPVYRRHRQEKLRRRRLQRQQEEAMEASDEPLGPEFNGR